MMNILSKIPTLERLYIYKSDLFNRIPIKRLTGMILSWGITPNIMTLIGIAISTISVYFLFENTKLFAAFYLLGRFIDVWDGYMAREFKKTSVTGDRLDHAGDMLIHGSMLIKAIIFSVDPWISGIALAVFVGEYMFLRRDGLLKQKFPSGLFSFFFMFEQYRYGLVIQITYQIISYLLFKYRIGKHK